MAGSDSAIKRRVAKVGIGQSKLHSQTHRVHIRRPINAATRKRVSAGAAKEASDKAEPADDRLAVGRIGQIARVDRRRLGRVRRARLNIAARQRPHLLGPGGDAGEIVDLPDGRGLKAHPVRGTDLAVLDHPVAIRKRKRENGPMASSRIGVPLATSPPP